MNSMPLRYRISSWRQLPMCMSNNSRDLSLHVSEFSNNNELKGLRITVEHPKYGVLFAYVVDARGIYVSNISQGDLETSDILRQLAKFGFFIEFTRASKLSIEQIEYLMNVNKLGFDKLRKFAIPEWTYLGIQTKTYIVVFNSGANQLWLNDKYSPSISAFKDALAKGQALNLTEVSHFHTFNWDWLDYVADIDDLLRDLALRRD